jgi:hypothetical protein
MRGCLLLLSFVFTVFSAINPDALIRVKQHWGIEVFFFFVPPPIIFHRQEPASTFFCGTLVTVLIYFYSICDKIVIAHEHIEEKSAILYTCTKEFPFHFQWKGFLFSYSFAFLSSVFFHWKETKITEVFFSHLCDFLFFLHFFTGK